MPELKIEDVGTFTIPDGKRLVLALMDEGGIDQLHACGGNAKCTTCRVQFVSGEPTEITQAEKELLQVRGLTTMPGLRLSCQIKCDHNMTLKAISRLKGSGRADAGKRPADDIQPPPAWTTKE
jgi:ferredoxin